MTRKKAKTVVEIDFKDLDFSQAKAINDARVVKATLTISGPDLVKLCQARVLARALKDIDQAYLQMDAVSFNPSTSLDLEDEIRNKIVSLLQGMELGK